MTFKYFLPAAFLFGIIGFTPCHGSAHPDLSPILSKLDHHIKTQVQKKLIPGCAVAVVYQNKVVFMNAYGVKSIKNKEPIDIDTVFQLGSVSKPVAATLASILENKGVLKLDDPVNRYLPHFSLRTHQAANALKIRHILSHSSGVSRAGFNNLIEAHSSYDSILKALQATPVRIATGKRYDYHNAMFGLITGITQSATRTSFKDALHTNLLHPLSMTRTTSTLTGLLNTANKATPHIRNRRGGLMPCDTYSKGYYTVAPAGGINSTVRDMAAFLKAQMGGSPEVLDHKALSRMHTPHVHTPTTLSPYEGPPNLIKNARYGLGWRIVDFSHHPLLFHGGWVKGFTNFIAFMPDQKVGIIILQNSETRFSSRVAMKFFELFLDIKPHKKLQQGRQSKNPIIFLKRTKRVKQIRPIEARQAPVRKIQTRSTQVRSIKPKPIPRK